MQRAPDIDWDTVGNSAKIAGAAIALFGIGWMTVEAIWPAHAAWRAVCDRSHTQVQYVPVTNCTNGNCSTYVETYTTTICDASHWECRKGRDGSTVCKTSHPGSDY